MAILQTRSSRLFVLLILGLAVTTTFGVRGSLTTITNALLESLGL
jgi:hypothetical protein